MDKINLHQLQPGRRHISRKRIGRGESSGQGKTAGRGQKGQRARSGGRVRPGFEGGQMPLFRRIPKFRQNNLRSTPDQIVNLRSFGGMGVTEINPITLHRANLIAHPRLRVKVLAMGDINQPLSVRVHAISVAARKKILDAGGTVTIIERNVTPTRRVNQNN